MVHPTHATTGATATGTAVQYGTVQGGLLLLITGVPAQTRIQCSIACRSSFVVFCAFSSGEGTGSLVGWDGCEVRLCVRVPVCVPAPPGVLLPVVWSVRVGVL